MSVYMSVSVCAVYTCLPRLTSLAQNTAEENNCKKVFLFSKLLIKTKIQTSVQSRMQ